MANIFRGFYSFFLTSIILCYSVYIFGNPETEHVNTLKKLEYKVTYLESNEKPILRISVKFKSDPWKRTIIELPSHYGEADNLYKNIKNIKAIGARIEQTERPSEIILYHASNQTIILNYDVIQGWNGPVSGFNHILAPIFQKDYFQFLGNGVLIYPKSYKKYKKIALSLDWNLPNGWKIENSYENNNTHQEIITTLDAALNSLFIGGHYRFYDTPVKEGIISTAIYGNWTFQDKEFIEKTVNIIENERAFWNIHHVPHFLITLIPVTTDTAGMSGTAASNAFLMALKSDHPLDYPVWSVTSHECFHIWNKPELFDVSDEDQMYYYWFTEGFTDYYANLLNLRIELISLPDYIKQYNKTLVDYYSTPVNSSTIVQVKKNFWTSPETQRLPYQQGTILATNWNMQIKEATHHQNSLDDLMRSLILFSNHHSKLTLHNMSEVAKQYKKEDLIEDIQSIYSGHLVSPSERSLGPCVYKTNKMLAPYRPGFNVAVSKKEHIITSVNPKGKAFAAGLRNGQTLISIEEHPDDVSQLIHVTIKEGDQMKTIKYDPFKGELKLIPQFVLDQTKWEKQKAECLAWFGANGSTTY